MPRYSSRPVRWNARSSSSSESIWANFGSVPNPPCSASKKPATSATTASVMPCASVPGAACRCRLASGAHLGDTRRQLAAVLPRIGGDVGDEHAHLLGRDVRRARDDLAVGRQEDGAGQPAAVVAPVDIGALVGVDPHRDVIAVQPGDDLRIGVRRLVHDVAPVAPRRGEREQDRLVVAAGRGERAFGPRLPVDIAGAIRTRREAEARRRLRLHAGQLRAATTSSAATS